jgi:hypothetical protein
MKMDNSHLSLNSQSNDADWVKPNREEAYYGLAGDIVKTIEPHSEADPVALLVQLLASVGNIVGNKPHFVVEDDIHTLKIYPVMVGDTSKARKGTAWSRIITIIKDIEPEWVKNKVLSGLSSGEGLIYAVKDDHPTEISDKRILVFEPEFSSALKVLKREGNILSPVIRQAWDSCTLRTLTKNDPLRASDTHITIIGHITKEELIKHLAETEMANGFGNRFLWVYVKRSKCLPEGGKLDNEKLKPLIEKLRKAIEFADSVNEISKDKEATKIWCEVYPVLSEGKLGIAGALTARAEAYVMRLACLYALLDCSNAICPAHLKAALALWKYSEDSVSYIFGNRLGETIVDNILDALKEAFPKALSRTDINNLFSRHKSSADIARALKWLKEEDKVYSEYRETLGRKEEVWYLKVAK